MNNRTLARLCIFIAIILFSCGIYGDDTSTLPRLVINRRYYDDTAKEEKREGQDIIFNCEYNKSVNMNPILAWYHNDVKIGEVDTEKRVYVLDRTNNVQTQILKLTLKNLHSETDDGVYECKALSVVDNSVILSRKVKLEVIKPARWRDTAKVAAGLIDDQLTVDCRADGDPTPDISIQLQDGSQLPENYVKEGDSVKISNLQLSDRNQEIVCTAAQVREDSDDNPVVVKVVTIDVYYPPTFEGGDTIKRYGIMDRNVSIPCKVADANPNVNDFKFHEFKTDEPGSTTVSIHSVTINLMTQSAYLYIPKLEDEHFEKTYECTALNGKYQSSQKISLERTNPPDSPHVAQRESDEEYSLKYLIEDDKPNRNGHVLPILKYHVKYLEEKNLGVDTDNLSNPAWNNAKEIELIKTPTNEYKISGLKTETRYAFRFQSVNEAGSSDWGQIIKSKIVGRSHRIANGKSSLSSKRNTFSHLILPQMVIFIYSIYYQIAGRF